MSTPTPPPTTVAPRRRTSALKMMFWLLLVPIVLIVGYFAVVLNWNYSTGERAGWVQKLSRKGWLCKTWEGEMAMVSMPGAIPEKFLFTVRDDTVAESINKVMGKRVTLHYEEKVGLPTTCFGETRHFVTSVSAGRRDSAGAGSCRAEPACRTRRAPAASPSTQPAPPSPLPSTTAPPTAPETSPAKN